MKVVRHEELDFYAAKFESDDKGVVTRAANAVVRTRGETANDKTEDEKVEINEGILAIGAVTKRIYDNRAPVYLRPMEEGIAFEVGEEGYGTYDRGEIETVSGFLQEYAHATVDAVPSYKAGGGLNTTAWERAYYGYAAGMMATQLTQAMTSETV